MDGHRCIGEAAVGKRRGQAAWYEQSQPGLLDERTMWVCVFPKLSLKTLLDFDHVCKSSF
jgi:hypothetical protein